MCLQQSTPYLLFKHPNWLKPTFFTLVRLLFTLKSAVRDVVKPEIIEVIIVATDNGGGLQT